MNLNELGKNTVNNSTIVVLGEKLSISYRCSGGPLPLHSRATGRNNAPTNGSVHFPGFGKIGMVNFRQKYRG
jgi:hypothetical protein